MTFDIDKIPAGKLSVVDIIHHLLITPSMWAPCILLGVFTILIILELVLGDLMLNEKHAHYCAVVITANQNFNTSLVGVGC